MSLHLITTRAEPGTCRCGVQVLRGHAEGLSVVVDAKPIQPNGEHLILLEGLWTFSLNGRGELWHRSDWRIRGAILNAMSTIHAQHVCPKPHEQLELPL